MNLLNDNDPANQAARSWSERMGNLAAELPASRPTAPSAGSPSRLAAILDHLRRRTHAREHAADKLRANELITGA